MIRTFTRYYPRLVLFGLIALIWFAAFFRAAHDLWAASLLFAGITLLTGVFCAGRLQDQKNLRLPLALPVLLCILAFALSLRGSYDVETTWLELWGWLFTFLAFYLFVNVVETPREVEKFMTLAGGVILPLTVISFWQPWTVPGGPRVWGVDIHATLINSAVLAGFLLHWPIFYWKKMLEDSRYRILFFVCILSLLLTRSWAAYGVLAFGFTAYYEERLRSFARTHSKTACAVGLLGTLTLVLLLSLNWHRAEGRWNYWLTALHIWSSHPWTGVGLGGFATAYPHFKIGAVENTRSVHSFPLQLLAETGLAGAAAAVFLATHFFRRGTSVYRVTLLMILAFSLLSIHMDYLLNKLLLFLFLGAALIPLSTQAFRIRPLWTAAAGVSLLLLSAFWLSLFAASRLYTAGLAEEHQGNLSKAEQLYRQAIHLEPFHADSYWRLSQIYQARFQKDASPETQAAAQACLQQAVRYRKDIRFLKGATNG